jgi:hypothetical protein
MNASSTKLREARYALTEHQIDKNWEMQVSKNDILFAIKGKAY